jgi:heterodisulfide reductase subunit C
MVTATTQARAPTFLEQVVAATPGDSRLEMCIQCGTCGGSCPSGADMDHTPRAIFAMLRAGMREEVLKSSTPWMCVSCYYCTVRCPQEIHITDIMYTIKRASVQAGLYRDGSAKDMPGFSQDFISFVDNYGRSFELGLASLYHLKHHFWKVPGMAQMGLGMMRKSRMDLIPKHIKGIDQLKSILAKAKELDGAA